MKTLLGDYNDGSEFDTATQVDVNHLSVLPEHRSEPVLVCCFGSFRRILEDQ